MIKKYLCWIGLVGLISGVALAEKPVPQKTVSPAEKEGGWAFSIAGYLWMAGLKGDEGVVGAGPAANVDLDFKEITETLDFAMMMIMETRKGKWGILNDFIYIQVSGDLQLPGPLESKMELDQMSLIDTLAVSYRVVEEKKVTLDCFAGARLWYVDTELTVTPQRDPNRLASRPRLDARVREPDLSQRKFQEDEFWVDPVVGFKVAADLGHRLSVAAGGTFGMGAADEDWSLIAVLAADVTDHIQLMGGYRHLSVDYEKNGFVYDIEMSGPILGAALRF